MPTLKKSAKKKKANLAKIAAQLASLVTQTKTEGARIDLIKSRVALKREQRLVAVMCPLLDAKDASKPCGEQFPLKKRGDRGSYNFAAWDRHLAEVHGLKMPSPVDVMGW